MGRVIIETGSYIPPEVESKIIKAKGRQPKVQVLGGYRINCGRSNLRKIYGILVDNNLVGDQVVEGQFIPDNNTIIRVESPPGNWNCKYPYNFGFLGRIASETKKFLVRAMSGGTQPSGVIYSSERETTSPQNVENNVGVEGPNDFSQTIHSALTAICNAADGHVPGMLKPWNLVEFREVAEGNTLGQLTPDFTPLKQVDKDLYKATVAYVQTSCREGCQEEQRRYHERRFTGAIGRVFPQHKEQMGV